MTTKYWTYQHEDDMLDYECATQKEAQDAADAWWEIRCQEEGGRNGTYASAKIQLIEFHYDDDGEKVVDSRVDGWVEHEFYHGDYKEHNTYHKGGAI